MLQNSKFSYYSLKLSQVYFLLVNYVLKYKKKHVQMHYTILRIIIFISKFQIMKLFTLFVRIGGEEELMFFGLCLL